MTTNTLCMDAKEKPNWNDSIPLLSTHEPYGCNHGTPQVVKRISPPSRDLSTPSGPLADDARSSAMPDLTADTVPHLKASGARPSRPGEMSREWFSGSGSVELHVLVDLFWVFVGNVFFGLYPFGFSELNSACDLIRVVDCYPTTKQRGSAQKACPCPRKSRLSTGVCVLLC